MKSKITSITAVLAVMVAMTGLASAYDAAIYNAAGTGPAPNPINLPLGSSITLSYHASNIDPAAIGVSLPYFSSVQVVSGSGSPSDITITTPQNFKPTSDPFTDVGAINVALKSSAPTGVKYRVTIGAGSNSPPVTIEFGSAARNITSVPEFPTVALPVAAIMGLVFLQYRRRKENN